MPMPFALAKLTRRVLVIAAAALLPGLGITPAEAAAAQPLTDWSFYILSTSTSRAYNLGCNQGKFDASHGNANSEVFLDFGGQTKGRGGTELINGTLISNGTVESISEQFAYGYWICTGADRSSVLRLAISTNNSLYAVDTGGGQTWANIVGTVQNWVNSHAGRVIVRGGNDIEPSYSSAPAAEAWANGFSGASESEYLNYGSADGCPQSTAGGRCSNGWYVFDVWDVSSGIPGATTAPEIYYSANASQWAMISLYGALRHSGAVRYQGPLDEYDLSSGTNTSSQAWAQLWDNLNARSATAQTPSFSFEVHSE